LLGVAGIERQKACIVKDKMTGAAAPQTRQVVHFNLRLRARSAAVPDNLSAPRLLARIGKTQ